MAIITSIFQHWMAYYNLQLYISILNINMLYQLVDLFSQSMIISDIRIIQYHTN